MSTYVNSSGETRVWPHLTNPATGRTLELEPGETADLDLPEGFEDPNLTPAEGDTQADNAGDISAPEIPEPPATTGDPAPTGGDIPADPTPAESAGPTDNPTNEEQ